MTPPVICKKLHRLIMYYFKIFLSILAAVYATHSKAGELGELIQVREGLRERMRESPLMDGPGFVSALESALATVLENEQ